MRFRCVLADDAGRKAVGWWEGGFSDVETNFQHCFFVQKMKVPVCVPVVEGVFLAGK